MAHESVTKSAKILYLYQPTGTEDRIVGTRSVIYLNAAQQMKKAVITRGLQSMDRIAWESISKTPFITTLIDSQQLMLVADSLNLIKDAVKVSGANGLIKIENLIDRVFDNDLLEAWAAWLRTQDLSSQAKYGVYLNRINERLAMDRSPWDLPRFSTKPLEPSANNFAEGMGQL